MTRRMHANLIKALVFVIILTVLAIKLMVSGGHH